MITGKNQRRAAAAVAVALGGAAALAGCSGSSNSSATELSTDPVTITVTFWGGDARVSSTQEAIDAFEAEYPNITVEPQYTDWNGYWDQLATQTAAGDMPDVVQMDELYLASYGNRGALYDLSNLNIDTTNFDTSAVDLGKVDGTQYAMPIGVGVYAIIANKTLFDQYGIALPDDDTWTWDDYAALADELTEASGGAITGSTQIGGFDAGSVKYWARSEGGELFGEDNTVTLDPQALADMWQFQLDLQASGGMLSASAITESQNAGINAGALATNAVALGTAYNTQITAIQGASGDDFVLLKLPEPEGIHPNSYKPSMYWSISSQTEHPAEAALFVNWLLNSDEAGSIIKTERGVPANNEVRAAITPDLSELDQTAIAYQDSVTPGDAPLVTPNGASSIETILARYTQEVFAGQSAPLDAANAFISELQGEIDAAN
ncbi:MAG: extracellular solute-binding protein [Microbacterium sp.]|uniref:ABC transporter substrate-binding protein n=1 Tax=Microbacterium sp. TaxID=51671 RepID=UPI0039E71371